jgi:hypothetical protein
MLFDEVTRRCIVSDTMFRICIPGEVKRATARHKQTCGCVTCITMYSQLITLVAYRKMRLGKMQAEIDNQGDSDQKEKLQSVYHQYYADVMLPNGMPRLVSTREVMCSILCPTVDDTNIHRLQCACGHCNQCPKG